MLIRDLERKTGLDRATIRFYERESLISPMRSENGYREYTEEDCENLLKIKLLRQLGVSVERIRNLQQGSEGVSDALNEQIKILEREIQSRSRAKEVCILIRDEGAGYDSLDARRYLEELSKPLPNVLACTPKPVPEFQEHLRRERHPFKRYFARYLDGRLVALTVSIVISVILRLRFQSDFMDKLITHACYLLCVPVNALWMHRTGTTPGKWVLGLGVESCNGGRLSWKEALQREWNVLRYGYGFHIPIWSLWRLYKSWKEDKENGRNSWDEYSEYFYGRDNRRTKCALVGMILLILAMIGLISSDSVKPRYIGAELTVSQFAEDYNYYISIADDDSAQLDSTGRWIVYPSSGVVLYLGGTPEEPNRDFEYTTTEDGYITSITYQNSWTDVSYLNPLEGNMANAAGAFLMAQRGTGLRDLNEFLQIYEQEIKKESGHIVYENIEINWDIRRDNCSLINYQSASGYYTANDKNAPSSLTLWFEIKIHQP